MSREAIEEAIEVLEDASADMLMETGDKNYYIEAIAVLRQALETEQEPVAWMFVNEDGECEQIEYGPVFDDPGVTPLYASPPKREWVGLTDEEIQDLGYLSEKFDASNSEWFDRWGFAQAIEAKLKDKNGG
jgi:hypothetical protein